MNKITLAYIAGLFDGEGCFTLTRRDRVNSFGFQPQILLSSTDKDVIWWLKDTLGFGYYTEKKRLISGGYKVYNYGVGNFHDVKKLLDLLLPYLKIKRNVAKLLYEWIAHHKVAPRGRAYGSYQIPSWELNIFDQIHKFTQKRSSLRI